MLDYLLDMNIDPCHICHHRSHMSQATPVPDGFSIRRHAVQQLLRQTLDAAPGPVFGLLGGHNNHVESVLSLHDMVDADGIQDALQIWQDKKLRLLASFSNEQNTLEPTALLPDAISSALPSLPQLIIRSDTKGRIEAVLLTHPSNTQTQTCPLEMQEDGGLYPLLDKG